MRVLTVRLLPQRSDWKSRQRPCLSRGTIHRTGSGASDVLPRASSTHDPMYDGDRSVEISSHLWQLGWVPRPTREA